jgi:hypothetical protein
MASRQTDALQCRDVSPREQIFDALGVEQTQAHTLELSWL